MAEQKQINVGAKPVGAMYLCAECQAKCRFETSIATGDKLFCPFKGIKISPRVLIIGEVEKSPIIKPNGLAA